ncbi:zf-HC2 domain-containing protein [Ideonella sp. YS5]|uniref:zf-HC2 domain-containing protein n=1 Tax=Ideonella sp. YS5 TaxID=3453714 RepID=UPI003EE90057
MKTTENRLHQETWALLPWLANGRADAAQRRRAESHLAECADCRAELAREQRLTAAMALPSMSGPDMSQGMARLMQRIDHAESVRAPRQPRIASGGSGRAATIRLSTATVLGAVQLALVAMAAVWWVHGHAPAEAPAGGYQTLTQAPASATPSTTGLRVVFHAGQPIGELQALLVTHGLAIVSGPTEAGVFTLNPTAPLTARELDAVASELRRSPAVAFAEATGPVAAR